MNAESSLYEKVCIILSRELGVERNTITANSLIVEELGADSLDMAEISMVIKDEFGYDLKNEEVFKIKKVHDLVVVLSQKEHILENS